MTGRPDSVLDSRRYATTSRATSPRTTCCSPPGPRPTGSGCAPGRAGAGAGLRFLAAAIGARAVVEIGTGTGVSGLWLLRGMAADGVLTSIDMDPEHQRAARGGVHRRRARAVAGCG